MAIDLIGIEVVKLEQCYEYAEKVNPGNKDLQMIAWLLFQQAKIWPGKPALKFAQMLKETRNYKSMLSQAPFNNLGGIGAVVYNYPASGTQRDDFDGKYKTALKFGNLPRAVDGLGAHWLAYIDSNFNAQADLLDARYSLAWNVRAKIKVARTTDDFSNMWAANAPTYGTEWENIYNRIKAQ